MNSLNPVRFALHHLYLLQLEEYDLNRYMRFIFKTKGVPVDKPRKKIVWTSKAKAIFVLSFIIQIITAYSTTSLFQLPLWTAVMCFVVFMYTAFFFLVIANALLLPLDLFLKKQVLAKAKEKISRFPNLTIIGIAGSYGKTTMKEAVYSVLSQKYSVLKTPDNINTPLGISYVIEKKLDANIQFLIVEMGEYTSGDIRDICQIIKPHVGIITGINEAHLERMGSLQKTTETIFELAQWINSDGPLYLNADDKNIMRVYQLHVGKHSVELYKEPTQSVRYLEEGKGIEFRLATTTRSYNLTTRLLGRYTLGTIMAAVMIGEKFDLSEKQILKAVELMIPHPHRLQLIEGNNNILVIDDSYNGNPAGVQAAIEVLSRFTKRRKIYITPGLVETGLKNTEIHYNIGVQLAAVTDKVILIKNSATPAIEKGLLAKGFSADDIIWFESAQAAHIGLAKITRPNDIILFQNDWPDNYI